MNRRILSATCAGLLGMGLGQQGWAEDLTVNRLLASQCAQCHGTDGRAVGDMDGLHDESYKDLYEDLMDMRKEDRPENIMDHQALGYTQDQVRRIALYYGLLSGKADEAPEGGSDGVQSESEQQDRERSGTRRSRGEYPSRGER